jgi:hypothetical protein
MHSAQQREQMDGVANTPARWKAMKHTSSVQQASLYFVVLQQT